MQCMLRIVIWTLIRVTHVYCGHDEQALERCSIVHRYPQTATRIFPSRPHRVCCDAKPRPGNRIRRAERGSAQISRLGGGTVESYPEEVEAGRYQRLFFTTELFPCSSARASRDPVRWARTIGADQGRAQIIMERSTRAAVTGLRDRN